MGFDPFANAPRTYRDLHHLPNEENNKMVKWWKEDQMGRELTSEEEEEIRLLSLANHKRKFALEFNLPMTTIQQDAFERGIDNEWFTLVDISPVALYPRRVLRIFRLTEAGFKRLGELLSLKPLSNLDQRGEDT